MKSKRITIKQVAAEAGVSLATVSRVMNNAELVAEDKVKLVNDAIEKLGYIPSNFARGLAKSSSTSVAIVMPSTNYSFLSKMMSGMLDVCKIYGYIPMLFTFENSEDASKEIDLVLSSQADGIVVFNSELKESDLQKILKVKIPMVVIGDTTYGSNALVYADYSNVLEDTINRFIQRSLRNICYIKDPVKNWHIDNEYEMVLEQCCKGKANYEKLIIDCSYNVVYEYFKEKFSNKRPKHELYVTNKDSLATAIINAAIDNGYKLPDDLEVLGIIGSKHSITSRPTISSIDTDLYELGSISMRMLTKMLNNTLNNYFYKFRTNYIKRDSTKD